MSTIDTHIIGDYFNATVFYTVSRKYLISSDVPLIKELVKLINYLVLIRTNIHIWTVLYIKYYLGFKKKHSIFRKKYV